MSKFYLEEYTNQILSLLFWNIDDKATEKVERWKNYSLFNVHYQMVGSLTLKLNS